MIASQISQSCTESLLCVFVRTFSMAHSNEQPHAVKEANRKEAKSSAEEVLK